VHIPLKDVLAAGKKMQGCALVDMSREHRLVKAKDMAKVDGSLKAAVSMIFSPEDTDSLQAVSPGPPASLPACLPASLPLCLPMQQIVMPTLV
jgi:hypothetical protein